MTTWLDNSPWVVAFFEEINLPSAVLGPVDFRAFFLLALYYHNNMKKPGYNSKKQRKFQFGYHGTHWPRMELIGIEYF